MAKALIDAGICGFKTVVVTEMEGDSCKITLQSDCPAIMRMSDELTRVDPFKEISFRRNTPSILQAGAKFCTHAACPVPVGIIKAVEVEAGLALPADAKITVTRE